MVKGWLKSLLIGARKTLYKVDKAIVKLICAKRSFALVRTNKQIMCPFRLLKRTPSWLRLAVLTYSLTHYAKGKPSLWYLKNLAKLSFSKDSKIWLIVHTWVQDLFHSHKWVLFIFPSRYLFTIDQGKFLGLEDGSPIFKHNMRSTHLFHSFLQCRLCNILYKHVQKKVGIC